MTTKRTCQRHNKTNCLICKAGAHRRTRATINRKEARQCRAFALCDQPATTTLEHSVLGAVPACARCKARLEAK